MFCDMYNICNCYRSSRLLPFVHVLFLESILRLCGHSLVSPAIWDKSTLPDHFLHSTPPVFCLEYIRISLLQVIVMAITHFSLKFTAGHGKMLSGHFQLSHCNGQRIHKQPFIFLKVLYASMKVLENNNTIKFKFVALVSLQSTGVYRTIRNKLKCAGNVL